MQPYSVLMSVYEKDRPDWFEIAVESMARQSLPPQEILIVEDGPLPVSLQEAEKRCCQRFPGLIRCISRPERQGLAMAMQYGVPLCSCEWIARMDADDFSDERRCEEELLLAEKVGADIVGCDCEEFIGEVEHAVARRVFPAEHDELIRFSRRKTPFCHPAVMMKKTAVLRAGNYREVYLLEDYDLFVRMLATGAVGCTVKKTLYHVRVGSDFYARRGGIRYVASLLNFNIRLFRNGWMNLSDFLIRSAGNILVGLAPGSVRSWFYRRFLRK